MKYLSKNLLIIGTKKIISKKTRGQDLIVELNQTIKNSLKSSREKKIVTPETVVLVQKDIIRANKLLASTNKGLNINEKIFKGNGICPNAIALFPDDVISE